VIAGTALTRKHPTAVSAGRRGCGGCSGRGGWSCAGCKTDIFLDFQAASEFFWLAREQAGGSQKCFGFNDLRSLLRCSRGAEVYRLAALPLVFLMPEPYNNSAYQGEKEEALLMMFCRYRPAVTTEHSEGLLPLTRTPRRVILQCLLLTGLLGLFVPTGVALRIDVEAAPSEVHYVGQHESLLRQRADERRLARRGNLRDAARARTAAALPIFLRPLSGCYLPNGLPAPLRC
jgi:hypothetical protein